MHERKRHCAVAVQLNPHINNMDADFTNLPEEMLEHIFSFLDVYALLQTRRVSNFFHRISLSNNLWKSLTEKLLKSLNNFIKNKDYQRFFNEFPYAFQLLALQVAHADKATKICWESNFKILCINKLIIPFVTCFVFRNRFNNDEEIKFLNKLLVVSDVVGIDTKLLLDAAYERYKRLNTDQPILAKKLIFPALLLVDWIRNCHLHSSVDSKIAHWLTQHKILIDKPLFDYYLTKLLHHALVYQREDLTKVLIAAEANITNVKLLLWTDYATGKLGKLEVDNALKLYETILQKLTNENVLCYMK